MSGIPQWAGQAARFGLVAPLVFAVDWAVLAALGAAGLPPLAGRPLSLGASVGVGFLANRAFTFRAAGQPSLREFGRYVAAALMGILVNYGVFAVAVAAGVKPAAAIAAGMGAAALLTFTRFRAIFRA